jgi:hypothetical protein
MKRDHEATAAFNAEAERQGVSPKMLLAASVKAYYADRMKRLGILASLQQAEPPTRIRAHGSWHQLNAALDAAAAASDIAHAARTHRDWHGGRRVRNTIGAD